MKDQCNSLKLVDDIVQRKKKSPITKDYSGCHILFSHHNPHRDTTECASLSETHCVTSIHLLNEIPEIKPRAKLGQKPFQHLAAKKEVCRREGVSSSCILGDIRPCAQ